MPPAPLIEQARAALWTRTLRTMESADPQVVAREEEINNSSRGWPHFVLLGAGASKAALPDGDKNGLNLPLLRDLAIHLELAEPSQRIFRISRVTNFEAAYSQLYERDPTRDRTDRRRDRRLLSAASCPTKRTCTTPFSYRWKEGRDLHLQLGSAPIHLARAPEPIGPRRRPPVHLLLHGNVIAAYCERDDVWGYTNGRCSKCGRVHAYEAALPRREEGLRSGSRDPPSLGGCPRSPRGHVPADRFRL